MTPEEPDELKRRAAYGQRQLVDLSARLTALFDKGFDVSNLRNMSRLKSGRTS